MKILTTQHLPYSDLTSLDVLLISGIALAIDFACINLQYGCDTKALFFSNEPDKS